jgi:phage gp46-like protein
MAKDIRLIYDTDFMTADINPIEGDLQRDEGLETAVFISIFTDRRAKDGDLIEDPTDKRGWWGDQTSSYNDDRIGSRMWLLERSKATQGNINKAKIYLYECLKWLIDDGVAQKIDITVEKQPLLGQGGYMLAFLIQIMKSDGTTTTYAFDDVWFAQVGA